MRRRFHVSWHDTHEDAVKTKNDLLLKLEEEKKSPKDYQIRKKRDKFDLMERLTTREATVIQEIRSASPRKHSRRRVSSVLH